MALLDIVGLTKRLEDGQLDLNDRLDRVIELLEALLDAAAGQGRHEVAPRSVRRAAKTA